MQDEGIFISSFTVRQPVDMEPTMVAVDTADQDLEAVMDVTAGEEEDSAEIVKQEKEPNLDPDIIHGVKKETEDQITASQDNAGVPITSASVTGCSSARENENTECGSIKLEQSPAEPTKKENRKRRTEEKDTETPPSKVRCTSTPTYIPGFVGNVRWRGEWLVLGQIFSPT